MRYIYLVLVPLVLVTSVLIPTSPSGDEPPPNAALTVPPGDSLPSSLRSFELQAGPLAEPNGSADAGLLSA